MEEIVNISISDNFPKDKRYIRRTTGSMGKTGPDQWPRLYGKPVKDCVKAKNWELRKYYPQVIGD